MKKNYIIIFTLLFVCCSWSETERIVTEGREEVSSPSNHSETKLFIEKKIHHIMRKKHLPALVITIVDNQDIVYQKSFGMADIENKVEAHDKTVFKLWSLAKVFTAIEIFREVEEGLIDLDHSILEYLPEFAIQSRDNEEDRKSVV
ncbi:MAG: Beta-lactamase [Bacteroidetes bacterium]|nr:Beta-lactamase [Bacteroidota bacterium]